MNKISKIPISLIGTSPRKYGTRKVFYRNNRLNQIFVSGEMRGDASLYQVPSTFPLKRRNAIILDVTGVKPSDTSDWGGKLLKLESPFGSPLKPTEGVPDDPYYIPLQNGEYVFGLRDDIRNRGELPGMQFVFSAGSFKKIAISAFLTKIAQMAGMESEGPRIVRSKQIVSPFGDRYGFVSISQGSVWGGRTITTSKCGYEFSVNGGSDTWTGFAIEGNIPQGKALNVYIGKPGHTSVRGNNFLKLNGENDTILQPSNKSLIVKETYPFDTYIKPVIGKDKEYSVVKYTGKWGRKIGFVFSPG
ncbi:MAG: hypothetical protein NT030_01815, partial [Candidatus Saganbacteria bacterium]|nr:hypothetical protein [Candidatus Saganbacteria bacterium]